MRFVLYKKKIPLLLRIRIWLLKKLLTDGENYLLSVAINDRLITLNNSLLDSKWIDNSYIRENLLDYKHLQDIFYIRDYN
jgi:hypothetical protein